MSAVVVAGVDKHSVKSVVSWCLRYLLEVRIQIDLLIEVEPGNNTT